MNDRLQRVFNASTPSFRIAAFYAVIGLLWIWLSDWTLNLLGWMDFNVFLAGAIKGTGFVISTAFLLAAISYREFSRLQKSEILLRTVVNGTSDMVFVKDLSGKYLLVNSAAAKFLGCSAETIIGQTDLELLEHSQAHRLMSQDQAILAGGVSVTFDETFWLGNIQQAFHTTKSPFHDNQGNVIGLMGIARDITDRKTTSDMLIASESRLREMADAIPQIVWTASPDGALTHLNAKAFEFTGSMEEDLIGWSWENVVHSDDLPKAMELWSKTLADGIPRTFEMRLRRADGEFRWHMARQHPIKNAAGAIQSWIGTCTDIHDLLEAEKSIRKTESRLQEAQRIAKMGSWSWEPKTDRVWWSTAEYELFGVNPQSIDASFHSFLDLLHPEDRPIAIARVEAIHAGANEIANDLRILRPNGTCIWIHSRARVTRNDSGDILVVEGTDQDVTEMVEARSQLQAERDRFEKIMEAVPVVICSLRQSPDGLMTMPYASPKIQALFGLTPAELACDASKVLSMIHPEDRNRVTESIIASAKALSLWRDEFRIQSPLRGEIWIEGSSSPIQMPDGSIVWHGYLHDVTTRREMEDSLRASERRFRLVLEAASSIAFTWDAENDLVTRYYSTEPALPITGEKIGTIDELRQKIHPDDLSHFDSQLADCLAKETEYHNRFRVIRPDGTLAYFEEFGYFDRGSDGICLTGISIDVTEREVASEAIKQSEARYRQLVDILPTAILVSANDRILYANPAFVELIRADAADDLVEKNLFDIVLPINVLQNPHDEISQGEINSTKGIEKLVVRKDGRTVPVFSVSVPILGYEHPATLVAFTDLTDRERATQLLRSVLESVNDVIITIDSRGIIGSANPAAVKEFGYAENELIGQNIQLLMPTPYSEGHDTYLSNYLLTGNAKVIGIGREVECLRRDKTTFPAELTVTEFMLEGQRRYTGVLRNITERKRLQNQFFQSQKLEAIGRLAGGVAHDFNNLLTVVLGYCEFLLSELSADDNHREAISTIRDAGLRATRLTQQLLAFSRKAVIEPKRVDINLLVDESVKLLRRLIGEDIALAVLTTRSPIYVHADPGQLEQVIMNLLVNARDAMPTGGRLTIETGFASQANHASPRYARISVSDTGKGMAEEEKAKAFEPFFTTKDVGKGTGLGLAVVHGIVTQSGGNITIDTSINIGTTFHIHLPLLTDSSPDPIVESKRPSIQGTETILLVEDEDAVREIARASLEAQGYKVLEASGSSLALRLAESYSGPLHLLISDVVMPEMGGRQLLDAIRKILPGIPVLFISGYTDDAVLLHGVTESCDAFLQKPFTPLGLVRKVREVLDETHPANTVN